MRTRKSGILLHPTSFPGEYGCGDLGKNAYKVIDLLKEYGQSILQILPIGPTGFGDSPYQSFSSFAGTPYIISFDKLIDEGLLLKDDLKDYPDFNPSRVDYEGLYNNDFKILQKAFDKFKNKKNKPEYKKFEKENIEWIEDYALFMAIKDSKNGASWDTWEENLRLRTDLNSISNEIKNDRDFYKFIQWIFYKQWTEFKQYANDNGIIIIGDIPIFVSYDSSDVWANQDLFHLDPNGKPQLVAGVPPDYFSETGQLWGNPLYKWDVMKKNNYHWWKTRVGHTLKLVDCVRVDHFRGFEAYWEIKYGETTAINGKWVKAPGDELFAELKKEFGDALSKDVIAEDLGIITKEVNELKDKYNFPGMKIFQFAPYGEGTFTDDDDQIQDNSKHQYRPENYEENCIAYPGTHDNDVLHGWFHSQPSEKQNEIMEYLGITDRNDLNFSVIKRISESDAKWSIFMIQDVFELTSEARTNTPGTCGIHNWSWRLTDKLIKEKKDNLKKLKEITKKTGRI